MDRAARARTPATTSAWAARGSVTGPFLDNMGIDMLQGGGKLFLGSNGRFIGPGHFGLLDLGDGVQKFSLHYEADLDRGGISVLDIRPLLWRDGWPVAGENFVEGTYQIESARTGTALETRGRGHAGRRSSRTGRARRPRRRSAEPRAAPARVGRRRHPHHRRRPSRRKRPRRCRQTGRPGPSTCASPHTWCRLSRSGRSPRSPMPAAIPAHRTSRSRSTAPTARSRPRPAASWPRVPAFTGAPEQLWRIDQLTDGTYRVMPKAVPAPAHRWRSRPSAAASLRSRRFRPDGDRERWLFKTP